MYQYGNLKPGSIPQTFTPTWSTAVYTISPLIMGVMAKSTVSDGSNVIGNQRAMYPALGPLKAFASNLAPRSLDK